MRGKQLRNKNGLLLLTSSIWAPVWFHRLGGGKPESSLLALFTKGGVPSACSKTLVVPHASGRHMALLQGEECGGGTGHEHPIQPENDTFSVLLDPIPIKGYLIRFIKEEGVCASDLF